MSHFLRGRVAEILFKGVFIMTIQHYTILQEFFISFQMNYGIEITLQKM